MPASYTLRKEFTPFLLFMMLLIVFMLSMLFYAAIVGDFQTTILTFLLLGLMAMMVIVIAMYNKLDMPKKKTTKDHSLR